VTVSPPPFEIAGAYSTSFGTHAGRSLASLAQEAAAGALADAGCTEGDVGCIVFGNAAEGILSGQEMIRAQVAFAGSGLAGIPMFNVENACASGSTALHVAGSMVRSGEYGDVLVVGAEKLIQPDKAKSFAAIRAGIDQSLDVASVTSSGSLMMGYYAAEARSYTSAFGPIDEALAAVAVKNRTFAGGNPKAQFRGEITAADVLGSRLVADPLRLLMCAPMTDGAAAVLLRAPAGRTSPRRKVMVAATAAASHRPRSQVVKSAVDKLYASAGVTPADVKVWQLHDACAFAEISQYEQVGIAKPGKGAHAVLDGRTGLGGSAPVNTDGGLLSRGHPLGATGVAQIVELTRQLRAESDVIIVRDADVGVAISGGGWMGDDYAACFATLLVRH
jgi:acetyl-CoA acetyltransferase